MDHDDGCLVGILKLFMLGWLFDWLQDNFGFGRGCSCSGCGCGVILLLIFLALVCSVISNTDWFRLTMNLVYSLV